MMAAAVQQPSLEQLIEEYFTNPPKNSQERALLEHRIWLALPNEIRMLRNAQDGHNAKWLYEKLGERLGQSQTFFTARSRAIYKQEYEHVNVQPVWDYLDQEGADLQPSRVQEAIGYANKVTGSKEHRKVSREAREQYPIALKQYLENPQTFKRDTQRTPSVKEPVRGKAKKVKPAAPPVEEPPAEGSIYEGGAQAKRIVQDAQDAIRGLVKPYIEERLKGLESDNEIEIRLEKFFTEMGLAFQNLFYGVRQVLRRTDAKEIQQEAIHVERKKISDALWALRIEHTRYWKKEDFTPDQVNKQFRILARDLHPDRNKDPRAVPRFKEVQEAYYTLKEYLDF